MNKKIFYLGAGILILIASAYITKKIKRQAAPAMDLPGIVIKDLHGAVVDLATFSGKPLVLNFWGTWCGPCRRELPGFEKAINHYKAQVNFVMISDEPVEKLIKFKEENNYTFFYAQSQKRFKELGITAVPVTYFYDANGKLTAEKTDPLTEDEIISLLGVIK